VALLEEIADNVQRLLDIEAPLADAAAPTRRSSIRSAPPRPACAG
jgi:hypothetical protein